MSLSRPFYRAHRVADSMTLLGIEPTQLRAPAAMVIMSPRKAPKEKAWTALTDKERASLVAFCESQNVDCALYAGNPFVGEYVPWARYQSSEAYNERMECEEPYFEWESASGHLIDKPYAEGTYPHTIYPNRDPQTGGYWVSGVNCIDRGWLKNVRLHCGSLESVFDEVRARLGEREAAHV